MLLPLLSPVEETKYCSNIFKREFPHLPLLTWTLLYCIREMHWLTMDVAISNIISSYLASLYAKCLQNTLWQYAFN